MSKAIINFKNIINCSTCRFWRGNYEPRIGMQNMIEIEEGTKAVCLKDNISRIFSFNCSGWKLKIEFGGE